MGTKAEVAGVLAGVVFFLLFTIIAGWVAFLADPNIWHLGGLVDSTAMIVLALIVGTVILVRSHQDEEHGVPPIGGHGPDDIGHEGWDGHDHGVGHGRSHRTFASTSGGHLASAAGAFQQLVGDGDIHTGQVMVARNAIRA